MIVSFIFEFPSETELPDEFLKVFSTLKLWHRGLRACQLQLQEILWLSISSRQFTKPGANTTINISNSQSSMSNEYHRTDIS